MEQLIFGRPEILCNGAMLLGSDKLGKSIYLYTWTCREFRDGNLELIRVFRLCGG